MTEADRISQHARVERDLARLVVSVAERRGCLVKDLRGESRAIELVCARRVIVREAFAAGFGVSEIGRALNRDHSTVVHHVRSTGARRRPDKEVQLSFLVGPLFDGAVPNAERAA